MVGNEKKAFDPTVSFMFFGSWVKTIEAVRKSLGESAAFYLYSAIANYSMYDIEPVFSDFPILEAVWITVEREIDISINNRKRGFVQDGLNEKYQKIIFAIVNNPSASLREIGEMTGTDKNMVDRVKKKYSVDIDNAIAAKHNAAANASIGGANIVSSNSTANASVNGSNTVSVNDTGNDSMRQDTRQDNIGQFTCSLHDWTEEKGKERFQKFFREYNQENETEYKYFPDDTIPDEELPF